MDGKVITICSGKGGVGKTVSAINLATSLNELGKEVVIVDGNFTTPNVSLHLGAPTVPITLNHVMQGKKKIYEAIYRHHSGTKVVPASISLNALKGIKLKKFDKAIQDLAKHNDIIIIDAAAGLGKEAIAGISIADSIIIATIPEMPAITDALKTIKMAEKLRKKVIGVVLTRVRKDRHELSVKEVQELLEVPVLAKIPEDSAVRQSIMRRNAVTITNPRSRAARNYTKLAENLTSRQMPRRSFFAKIFGWK